MSLRSRRAAAALTSAIALTAGLIGVFGTGTAEAAPAGPADGVIAYQAANGSVHLINADGTGDRVFSALPATGSGRLSWAADGSRIALSGYGAVATAKVDGSAPTNVASGQDVSTSDGVYGGASARMVSSDGFKIYQQTSDGWSWAQPVLPPADEPAGVYDTHPVLSWRGLYAFTRSQNAATSVLTYNPSTKALKDVANAAGNPAFSADGSTIVYDENQGGTSQIGAVNADGSNQRTLTNDPAGAHNASLSPDGTKLVYTSYDSTRGNVVKLLDLTKGTTMVLANGQMPVWQPLRTAYVDHVYGVRGVSNDAAASRWQFNTIGKSAPGLVTAYNAVLVNRNDTTGAALGIALAAEKQAPLLLTSGTSLDAATAAELHRSLRRGWTVFLEGGASQLSAHLAAQVQRLGYRVVRVSGSGVSGQSAASARTVTSRPNWIVVADAQDYRTAASAAAVAATGGRGGRTVVLLNTGWQLPSTLTSYFNGLNPNASGVLVVGNRSIYAMEHTPLNRVWHFWTLGGTNPESLSFNLAKFWWGSPYLVTLASPADWRAGMAGASVNALYGPLLWTSATRLDPVDRLYLAQESASVGDVQLFGSGWPTATVSAAGGAIAAGPSWSRILQDPNGTVSPLTEHTGLSSFGGPVTGDAAHALSVGTTLS